MLGRQDRDAARGVCAVLLRREDGDGGGVGVVGGRVDLYHRHPAHHHRLISRRAQPNARWQHSRGAAALDDEAAWRQRRQRDSGDNDACDYDAYDNVYDDYYS